MALQITDAEFTRLVTYLHDNYGIDLHKKRVLIEGRLGNDLSKRGYTSYTAYLDDVMKDTTGAEITILLNRLTTNHTYFMREKEHYEFMEQVLLPELVASKKEKSIYLWSAGCSSGEEPYTTQMQLQEYLGASAGSWDTRILATDLSTKVLAKAQKAVYHVDSMKLLDPSWKTKYFDPVGDECFSVKNNIKKNVIFKMFNLMDPIPYRKHPFDLIFWRNVMIYFDLEIKLALTNRFFDVLAPGGYLFIGHAESIPRDKAQQWEYVRSAIYRKPLK